MVTSLIIVSLSFITFIFLVCKLLEKKKLSDDIALVFSLVMMIGSVITGFILTRVTDFQTLDLRAKVVF